MLPIIRYLMQFGKPKSVWDTSYARDTKGVAVQKVEPPTPGWSSGEPRPTSGVGAGAHLWRVNQWLVCSRLCRHNGISIECPSFR